MSTAFWIVALTLAQLAISRNEILGSTTQLVLRTLIGLTISSALYGAWSTWIYPAFFSPLRGLPSVPGGYGPLGHSLAKFGAPADTSLEQWLNKIPNDGMIRAREAFGGDAVIAASPAILKKVLVEEPYNFKKDDRIRRILRLVLGDGLIVVEGDVHKSQKQILRNSFSTGPIKDLYPIFWEKSVELLSTLESSLKNSKDGDRVAICQWCERVTLDIIGVAAFGENFDSLNKPADSGLAGQYHELLRVDTGRAIWFLLSFFLPQWIVANIPFWQTPRLATRLTGSLHEYAVQLAQTRRKEVKAGLEIKEISPTQRPDILSALIQTTTLTESQLADQILTLLAAGHETTSSALAWTAVSLSRDPKLQVRLRDEIRANIPSPQSGEIPKTLLLEKLPLLNAVCHETLRLFPTVPFTARTAVKPTRVGNTLLPKDGQVWLPVWAFNRSPHFWGSNASEFVPDRWITDGSFNNNGGAPSNYAQMTFLHGPRTCIGQGFAKGELRCLVAALFGRFHFELAEDESKYIPEGLVTVKPKNGGLLKVKVVDGW